MVTFKKLRRIFNEKGSGNVVSKTIAVSPFLQLHLCTQCNVEIVQSDEEKVVIEMDDNLIDGVRVDNSIKTLFVTQDLRQKIPLFTYGKITIYCHALEALYVTSHADIKTVKPLESKYAMVIKTVSHGDVFVELKAPSVKVMSTNHGDFTLKCETNDLVINNASKGDLNLDLKGAAVEINHKGRGDMVLTGSCDSLSICNEGHGDISGTDLVSRDVNVKSIGHGDTTVFASHSIKIQNLGHGDVAYCGDGELEDLSHTGHGKVQHKG
ncbi:DUF2807 domain-containing protein [Paludibacter sp.]|uniref:GIN domain-containing protein n=1 Tax=Paludibacter sp. TaxID=1898105 RepID=UPI001355241A|nr:DUF2807 domain-containing protein [Paludibacter sp.]MTK52548.1 hypothetical protein [Paludibacter sp.]